MWVSTAAIIEPNRTFPHISNNLKFPAFLQQVTQKWLILKNDWSSVNFYLVLASPVESTSSAEAHSVTGVHLQPRSHWFHWQGRGMHTDTLEHGSEQKHPRNRAAASFLDTSKLSDCYLVRLALGNSCDILLQCKHCRCSLNWGLLKSSKLSCYWLYMSSIRRRNTN